MKLLPMEHQISYGLLIIPILFLMQQKKLFFGVLVAVRMVEGLFLFRQDPCRFFQKKTKYLIPNTILLKIYKKEILSFLNCISPNTKLQLLLVNLVVGSLRWLTIVLFLTWKKTISQSKLLC